MIKKKIFILIFLIIIFQTKYLFSFENKILLKIDNEIITSIDVVNETRYLSALNKDFQKLDKESIYKISMKSLTREKIKRIEILNNTKNTKVDEDYLNQLIASTYKRLDFNNLEEFKNHLEKFGINIQMIKEKIAIESLWNELIYAKFSNKLIVNEDKLTKKIKKNAQIEIKSFLLSEIVFNVSKKSEIDEKYNLIKKDILEKGFKNAALKHSISDSANSGGDLGWINEDLINKKLNDELSNLEIGNYTKPIIIPGGLLILKLNDLKKIKNNINIKEKVNKLIRKSKNDQLNQFSNIYFNKIKKNMQINEL